MHLHTYQLHLSHEGWAGEVHPRLGVLQQLPRPVTQHPRLTHVLADLRPLQLLHAGADAAPHMRGSGFGGTGDGEGLVELRGHGHH